MRRLRDLMYSYFVAIQQSDVIIIIHPSGSFVTSHVARDIMSRIFASCIFSGPPFDSVSVRDRAPVRLARCSRTPVVARSHPSRRITGVPWSPGMGRRWYCHMADTGPGLRRPASKTAIAHPHKSTTDPTRVSLPPNYLIDVTRAVGRRPLSFLFFSSLPRYQKQAA